MISLKQVGNCGSIFMKTMVTTNLKHNIYTKTQEKRTQMYNKRKITKPQWEKQQKQNEQRRTTKTTGKEVLKCT